MKPKDITINIHWDDDATSLASVRTVDLGDKFCADIFIDLHRWRALTKKERAVVITHEVLHALVQTTGDFT